MEYVWKMSKGFRRTSGSSLQPRLRSGGDTPTPWFKRKETSKKNWESYYLQWNEAALRRSPAITSCCHEGHSLHSFLLHIFLCVLQVRCYHITLHKFFWFFRISIYYSSFQRNFISAVVEVNSPTSIWCLFCFKLFTGYWYSLLSVTLFPSDF